MMVYSIIQAILLSLLLIQGCLTSSIPISQEDEERRLFPNREHRIFNAIGSALRTEASVANPNGMSVFLAEVKAGSILYHGTFYDGDVKGYEWVSFEPNFATIFARRPIGRIPKKLPPSNLHFQKQTQKPLASTHIPPEDQWPKHDGNLRTYTPTHDLRLLYLDGLSALKRIDGSMDFQDSLLLFNRSIARFDDYYRAEKLCEMKRDRWQDKIDGFIRKDFEFEIIICQFEKDLKELDRVTLPGIKIDDVVWKPNWDSTILPNEAKDDAITQSIVKVNYDSLISVWNYPINVFKQQTNQTKPRLNAITKQEREIVLKDIDKLILNDEDLESGIMYDWQAVADAIVARYGPIFKSFERDFDNKHHRKKANETVTNAIFVYIDRENRSREKELSRCTNHMYRIPKASKESPTLISKAFQRVLNVVCTTMLDVYDEKDLWKSQKKVQAVSKILYWTPWTRHQSKHIEPWLF